MCNLIKDEPTGLSPILTLHSGAFLPFIPVHEPLLCKLNPAVRAVAEPKPVILRRYLEFLKEIHTAQADGNIIASNIHEYARSEFNKDVEILCKVLMGRIRSLRDSFSKANPVFESLIRMITANEFSSTQLHQIQVVSFFFKLSFNKLILCLP